MPLLEGMKVLTIADKKALELLCDAYGTYREARQIVIAEGSVFKTCGKIDEEVVVTGYKIRPEVKIAQESWKMVRAMLQEFGLTPAARSKVSVQEIEKEDSLDDFLNQHIN